MPTSNKLVFSGDVQGRTNAAGQEPGAVDAPIPEKIDTPRWNQKRERFECRVWYANQHGPSVEPLDELPSLPSLKGIRFIKGADIPTIDITHIAEQAQAAKAKFDDAPLHEQRGLALDIQAWNFTWRCIKTRHPDIAALLQDPVVAEFKKTFNAHIEIEIEEFKK